MPMNPRLLRPTPTGFDPRRIAGVYAWYDASAASSITLNGTTVSEWRDLSGGGRTLSQANASLQPTYTTAGQNGKNCLTFTGAGAGRRLTAAAAGDWAFLHDGLWQYAIYLVASSTASSGSGNVHTYLSTRSTYTTYNARGFDMTHDFGGLAANNTIRTSIAASTGMVGRRDMSATGASVVRCYEVLGDPANATSTARLAFRHLAGGTSSATSSAISAEAGDPNAVLTIGNSGSGVAWGLDGRICEIIFYRRATAITTAEASRITNYLTRKWGI